jgi:acyl carrier protein
MRNESPATLAKLVALLEKVSAVPVDAAAIGRDTLLAEDLALDSISLVALMALSEEMFGVDLSDHAESVAEIRSVGDALDLIGSLTRA